MAYYGYYPNYYNNNIQYYMNSNANSYYANYYNNNYTNDYYPPENEPTLTKIQVPVNTPRPANTSTPAIIPRLSYTPASMRKSNQSNILDSRSTYRTTNSVTPLRGSIQSIDITSRNTLRTLNSETSFSNSTRQSFNFSAKNTPMPTSGLRSSSVANDLLKLNNLEKQLLYNDPNKSFVDYNDTPVNYADDNNVRNSYYDNVDYKFQNYDDPIQYNDSQYDNYISYANSKGNGY